MVKARPAGCAGRVASPSGVLRTGGESSSESRETRLSPSSENDADSSIPQMPGGLSLVPLPATVRPALKRSVGALWALSPKASSVGEQLSRGISRAGSQDDDGRSFDRRRRGAPRQEGRTALIELCSPESTPSPVSSFIASAARLWPEGR